MLKNSKIEGKKIDIKIDMQYNVQHIGREYYISLTFQPDIN